MQCFFSLSHRQITTARKGTVSSPEKEEDDRQNFIQELEQINCCFALSFKKINRRESNTRKGKLLNRFSFFLLLLFRKWKLKKITCKRKINPALQKSIVEEPNQPFRCVLCVWGTAIRKTLCSRHLVNNKPTRLLHTFFVCFFSSIGKTCLFFFEKANLNVTLRQEEKSLIFDCHLRVD